MTLALRELYQEIILDHNRYPRNHYQMMDATTLAQGFNPVCGDKLTVYIKIKQNVVRSISFIGSGCAIAQASASLMTEVLQGKTLVQVHELFEHFHKMLTTNDDVPMLMDKLSVLSGVRSYPARVKCATLAWHTLEAALKKQSMVVSTE